MIQRSALPGLSHYGQPAGVTVREIPSEVRSKWDECDTARQAQPAVKPQLNDKPGCRRVGVMASDTQDT